jgi:hypothetical protein
VNKWNQQEPKSCQIKCWTASSCSKHPFGEGSILFRARKASFPVHISKDVIFAPLLLSHRNTNL